MVSGEVDIEDLIPEEESVFTLTHAGYIKRQPSDTYQAQRRGGRGITALSRKDEDFVEELFLASTHDYILFVTDMGRVYRLKGYQVYEGSRTSRGVNIVNLLPLQDGEQVTSMLRVPGRRQRRRLFDDGHKSGRHQTHGSGKLQQHPQKRTYRHQPERGRLPCVDSYHQRRRRADRCDAERHGHPHQ